MLTAPVSTPSDQTLTQALDANVRVGGVGLDLVADPEGPTGVEGEPADGDPVGTPLHSVGPEGAPDEIGSAS